MSERKVLESISNLTKSVDLLQQALQIPIDRPLVMEGTIHRFEMTIELTWKTMGRALNYEGVRCKTPRETLKAAHKAGWIADDSIWVEMVQRRNESSHEYLDQSIVQQNYDAAKRAFPLIREQLDFLTARYTR